MIVMIRLSLFFMLFSVSPLWGKKYINVSYEGIDSYWTLDQSRMSSQAPLEMIQLLQLATSRNGETWYEFEFVINKNGVPKDFLFFIANPVEGNKDKELLKKYILFNRYKPTKKNQYLQEIKIKANLRIGNSYN